MQFYIISYFLKKFTFINTEVEIASIGLDICHRMGYTVIRADECVL